MGTELDLKACDKEMSHDQANVFLVVSQSISLTYVKLILRSYNLSILYMLNMDLPIFMGCYL